MATTRKPLPAPTDHTPEDYERKLREALTELDQGEGMPMSDEEFTTIRREIEEMERRGVQGGASPTLERRIREREKKRTART